MTAPETHVYRILFTDQTLSQYVGEILEQVHEVTIIPRFREPGSAEVVCEAFPWLLTLINTPGTRAVVSRDGVREVAGPVEVGAFEWDAVTDGEDGNGRITFFVADDLALVVGRVSYPNPALAATAQDVARYTVSAVNAEVAMRALVNLNAGPGALTAREVPGLVLGAVASVGTNITYSTRFQPLGDDLRAMAIAGGDLGYRTVQVNLTVEFLVFQPADATTSARFSRGLGNLRSISYEVTSPTVTAAIVGGENVGAARVIAERLNSAAITDGHPRVERFIDRRDITDTTELDNAGDDELDGGQPSIRLSVVAVDTDAIRYRTAYNLGDIASVEVFPDVEVALVVQAVEIHFIAGQGETISPIIGTANAVMSGPTAALQRAILRQQAIAATAGEI